MGKPGDSKSREAAGDNEGLPSYTEAVQSTHDKSTNLPDSEPLTITGPGVRPYRPFPAVLIAQYPWKIFSPTFYLNNAKNERLFAFKVHTGRSRQGPGRPGVVLYDGTSDKDLMLAAAGDERGPDADPLDSLITLARFSSKTISVHYTEVLRFAARADTVAFRFSTEVVQDEEVRREDFEWRRSRGDDEDRNLVDRSWKCGFKLVRLSPDTARSVDLGEGASQKMAAQSREDVVAVIAWNSNWSLLTTPFKIEFIGAGRAGGLGNRFALVVIITGLRLWELKHQGRIPEVKAAS